jgi:segregation and condensation protein B
MDREECCGAAETGEPAALTCLAESPAVESGLSDALQPAGPEDQPELLGLPRAWPFGATDAGPRSAEDVSPAQIIEALLFSSDRPLSATRLAELAGVGSIQEVRLHVADLNAKYLAAGLSFRIEAIARGYQMLTQPRYRPWLARLHQEQARTRLSPAALETLSIVAYKQPVIRADVEAIRGVGCGEVLGRLREMGLVRIVGRAEIVGRPILYGTTREFLDVFGLADLEDLPPMEALTYRRSSRGNDLGETPVPPDRKPAAAEADLGEDAARRPALAAADG